MQDEPIDDLLSRPDLQLGNVSHLNRVVLLDGVLGGALQEVDEVGDG